MPFDFPASPSVGTLFAPAGGPTWQWNGTTWAATAPSGLVPEAPTDGQNYVRRNGVWVLAPGTAEAKSRIVNGAMQISQENGDALTAASASGNYYGADQWALGWSLSPGTASGGRLPNVSPNGSQRILYQAVGTAKPTFGATDYFFIQTAIEGNRMADFQWGTANAKQVVLRFWVQAQIAGTYSIQIQNLAADRSYIAGFTIAAGEAATWKQVVLVIPGDTTGTWLKDTGVGMYFRFVWAAASGSLGVAGWQAGNKIGFAGHSNGAATASTSFLVADVGLHLDPQNTGIAPPWQMPDEAQELAACQRYYFVANAEVHNTSPRVTNDVYRQDYISYPVQMRIVPASIVYGRVDGGGVMTPVNQAYRNGINVTHTVGNATSTMTVETWVLNARM